jgi:hypothetical protein
MMLIDLTGMKFNRLRVVERAKNSKRDQARWLCICECGGRKVVVGSHLRKGLIRSCGCLHKETLTQRNQTHGMRGSREYKSFAAAKSRCRNPKDAGFSNYGGRGIRFLYRDFKEFFADLGPRPPGTTLERCDNDGHYQIGNCQWASRIEQNNNTRSNKLLTAFGRTRTLARWAREIDLDPRTLRNRLRLGWSTEDALTRPLATALNLVAGDKLADTD